MEVDKKVINGVVAKARLVLTRRQFAIFEARYVHGTHVADLAEDFGCSESNIYKVLTRAKKEMKVNWR